VQPHTRRVTAGTKKSGRLPVCPACSNWPPAGKQAALLFPTGFAANAGTIAALAGADGCHIFSDALNHASIIDGARLAVRQGARLHVYRHSDMAHLELLLLQVPPGASPLSCACPPAVHHHTAPVQPPLWPSCTWGLLARCVLAQS
jgi:Aminotransferase class I and II